MLRKDFIKAIRAAKGPIYVSVSNSHDTFYIQAVKSDLIHVFNVPSIEETYMTIEFRHGGYYVDKDHTVNY